MNVIHKWAMQCLRWPSLSFKNATLTREKGQVVEPNFRYTSGTCQQQRGSNQREALELRQL